MRYKLDGYEIHSENAAKPAKQASEYLKTLLAEVIPNGARVLDYGCGKLRYAGFLAQTARELIVVDSEVQLSRKQVVIDRVSTVRDYVAENWPHVRTLNEREFKKDQTKFDFILCANVLSAIPHYRTRKAVVRLLGKRLKQCGQCLIVCQHTNSYFTAQMADKSVQKFGDGFIKGEKTNASFYGIIRPPELRKLVTSAGLEIVRSWVHDQSGFVLAGAQ